MNRGLEKYNTLTHETENLRRGELAKRLNWTDEQINQELEKLYNEEKRHLIKSRQFIYNSNQYNQKVEDVMSIAITIKDDVSIEEAISNMILDNFDFIIVTRDMNLEGILSMKDIIKRVIFEKIDIKNTPIREIMTTRPNIFYVKTNEEIGYAVGKLHQKDIDSMPVVEVHKDKNGKEILKVVGVFDKSVVSKLYLQLQED